MTSSHPDSAELATLPASEALPVLFEQHGDLLYSLGLRFCGGPDEAEDLVQDVFLLAYRNWDRFEGRSKPSTWLYTIAARACQRRHRLRSGEPKHMASLDELLPSRDGYVADLASHDGDDPFDRQVRREAREAVDEGLARLPVAFRMAVVLKDIVELPTAEVARVLGIKEATVKTRVHRGRLQLRRELSQRLPGRPAPAAEQPATVCLDLLQAKLDALDRGVDFELPKELVCSRCAAVFGSLDLARDACHDIARGRMPERLRKRLAAHLEGADRRLDA